VEGVGLHTGKTSRCVFKPCPANSGILFVRSDVPDAWPVRAEIDNLVDIERFPRRTSIRNEKFHIHTIEHLLSALFALEIDNILVEVSGEECPGLDGSSAPFCELLRAAGIRDLPEPREVFHLREPIYISENGSQIIALPSNSLRVSYTLDYPKTVLKSQYASFPITPETYERELAPARTFCLEEEVERLRALGLGLGSDYTNTLVIGRDGPIHNSYRFSDEPVRHKIADLIGDLALIGGPLCAHVIGIRSGHALNTRLIRKIKEARTKEKLAGVPAASFIPVPDRNLDIENIQQVIPHRFPFLLIDRVLEIHEDRRAVGVKNVTANEWFFEGHFPGRPVMPGVLIIEAMAQLAGVLMLSKKENRGKLAIFMAIDRVKFRKVVRPGDQLLMQVDVVKLRSRAGQIAGKTFVDGKIAAEATLMFTVVDS